MTIREALDRLQREQASDAQAFMGENWRLQVVAGSLTEKAEAWRRLDAVSESCRIRVLFAPWYRREESRRLRVLHAWRFPDRSHVVMVPAGAYPSTLEVLPWHGVTPHLMRDTTEAVRQVLRIVRVPLMETLAATYIDLHGGLPRLDVTEVLEALQAEHRAVRVAAIAAIRLDHRVRG